jgi:microtubule-associated protein-like 1/2
MTTRARSRSRSRDPPTRLDIPASPSTLTVSAGGQSSLLSPASRARELALRELLEREIRERDEAARSAGRAYDDYASGAARDPRLQLSYHGGRPGMAISPSAGTTASRERLREIELERARLSEAAQDPRETRAEREYRLLRARAADVALPHDRAELEREREIALLRQREYDALLRERELEERERLRAGYTATQGSSFLHPRALDRDRITAAGDPESIYPYGPGERYTAELDYESSEREYPSKYDSYRHTRRRSASPRSRVAAYDDRHRHNSRSHHSRHRSHSRGKRHGVESYAAEREREQAELREIRQRELSRERRLGSSKAHIGVNGRYLEEERERNAIIARRQAALMDRGTDVTSGLGTLSTRERERELRELEREEYQNIMGNYRSRSQTRRPWKTSTGALDGEDYRNATGYERARLGSPSRTALRSPVKGTYGQKSLSVSASFASAPYSSTFSRVGSPSYLVDPLRRDELEAERRARWREEEKYGGAAPGEYSDYDDRDRRLGGGSSFDIDRARARERELLSSGRYGSSVALNSAGIYNGGYPLRGEDGYDSDEDRERRLRHGRPTGHAYYQRHFSGQYGEPVGADIMRGEYGPSGKPGGFLEEFYRPVDVRSTKSQWLASLQPPSYTLRNNSAAPEARLKLEWVYGYKSSDCRNNLVYNNVGDIIYPIASIAVVYKHAHRIQRHFTAHSSEIRAMAQHPINLNIIATGQTTAHGSLQDDRGKPLPANTQAGKQPHIAVWDSTDFTKVWILPLTEADKSIRALAFSGNGKYLASISNDASSTIKLWDWETRTLLGSSRGDSYALFALKWNHKDPTEFVTVGKSHAVFWRFDGVKLTARKAILPGGKNMTFYSIAFSEKGYACLGGEDGSLYVFVDGRLVREFKHIHKGKIFCLDWFPGGLISGGGDGKVNILDKKLEVVRTFTFHHRITSVYCRGNHLLIGTQGSQIFEIVDFMETNIEGDTRAGGRPGQLALTDGRAQPTGGVFQSPDGRIGVEPIVQGHYDGELHGIAIAPGGREIVSVGEDNQICVWEMTTHRLLRRGLLSDVPGQAVPKRSKSSPAASASSHPSTQCARSVAVSPNGKFIVVGLNSGEVGVYTSGDLRRVFTHDLNQYSKRTLHNTSRSRHAEEAHPHWIQTIKFSPNGHVCAIGTHGAVIVLLDTRDEYRVKGVLQSHTSFLTNLDFSEDGTFLASTDGQYHLMFHQLFENDLAQSTRVEDQRLLRDVKWTNQNCVLGFTVQGILESGESEGSLVNCLEVSPSRGFVVAGDDRGCLSLYRYPVLEKGHRAHEYHSHSSVVANVRWSVDEKYVISTGGYDNAICQFVLQ